MKASDIWPLIKKEGNAVTIRNELAFLALLTALTPLLIQIGPLSPLRVVLGVLFVLVFPGYALLAVLFPDKEHIDWMQRLGLSVGVSIAIIPPIAYVLNLTPLGVSLYPIVVSLSVFTLSLSILAIYMRSNVAVDERFFSRVYLVSPGADVTKWSTKAKVYAAVAFVGIIVTGMWTYATVVPSEAERFTGFYVLGDAGLAQGYSRLLRPGQPASLNIGIDNYEREDNEYDISVRMATREVGRSLKVLVNKGESRIVQVDIVPYEPTDDSMIEILLFKSGSGEPSRSLRLWLDKTDTDISRQSQ